MAFKRLTLRRLPENTRKLARLLNELDSTSRKLKNFVPTLHGVEAELKALQKSNKYMADLLQQSAQNIKDEALEELLEQDSGKEQSNAQTDL